MDLLWSFVIFPQKSHSVTTIYTYMIIYVYRYVVARNRLPTFRNHNPPSIEPRVTRLSQTLTTSHKQIVPRGLVAFQTQKSMPLLTLLVHKQLVISYYDIIIHRFRVCSLCDSRRLRPQLGLWLTLRRLNKEPSKFGASSQQPHPVPRWLLF